MSDSRILTDADAIRAGFPNLATWRLRQCIVAEREAKEAERERRKLVDEKRKVALGQKPTERR